MTPDLRLTDRFWGKVREDGECWTWMGAVNSRGYGVTSIAGKLHLAHRAAFAYMCADIPDGLTIDHLCLNRLCVNPAHLDPVTTRVNNARSQPGRSLAAARVWKERKAA